MDPGMSVVLHDYFENVVTGKAEVRDMNFKRLISEPAVYYDAEKDLVISKRVDDGLVTRPSDQVDEMLAQLRQRKARTGARSQAINQ